jgi:putative membrane protein
MAAGILSFWLAVKYVPNVQFTGDIKTLIIAGCFLGLINCVIRPILNALTFPIRLLTLGLFGFVINMLMVWIVDIVFPELIIPGIVSLFLTTIIVWIVGFLLGLYPKK